MSYIRPVFVSERERPGIWVDGKSWDDARWEDCGPVSVIHLVNATTGRLKPATMTLDEAEKLRLAAGYGPRGGTNIQQLAAAAVVRYRIPLPRRVAGYLAIWNALKPGYGAAVAGSMGAFPDGHRLRRHAPRFEGSHAVYVQRETTTDRVLWIDPLAPSGYAGEWVSRDDFRAFCSRGIASAVVAPLVRIP